MPVASAKQESDKLFNQLTEAGDFNTSRDCVASRVRLPKGAFISQGDNPIPKSGKTSFIKTVSSKDKIRLVNPVEFGLPPSSLGLTHLQLRTLAHS